MKFNYKLIDLKEKTKYQLAKFEFLLDKYPDITTFFKSDNILDPYGYKSKSINSIYDDFAINSSRYSIIVSPYLNVPFIYNGTTEIIKIHSSPTNITLAKVSSISDKTGWFNVIKFSNYINKFSNNKINETCLNKCRLAIINFIKQNPNHKLIDKNIDPKIKKLLSFI